MWMIMALASDRITVFMIRLAEYPGVSLPYLFLLYAIPKWMAEQAKYIQSRYWAIVGG